MNAADFGLVAERGGNDFQRDRDRVIHSRAFRRLEAKTQVFTRRFSDHFRNRLTHTIEVAQIARTIAAQLGLVNGPMATLHSITGTSSVQTVNVPQLELTQNRVHSLEAPLLEAVNMGADGILGVDSLRSQRVLFDFKTRIISIVPSEEMM